MNVDICERTVNALPSTENDQIVCSCVVIPYISGRHYTLFICGRTSGGHTGRRPTQEPFFFLQHPSAVLAFVFHVRRTQQSLSFAMTFQVGFYLPRKHYVFRVVLVTAFTGSLLLPRGVEYCRALCSAACLQPAFCSVVVALGQRPFLFFSEEAAPPRRVDERGDKRRGTSIKKSLI